MSAKSKLMATGIPGLDQLLEGGIVRGNSLLIEGPPGSGKSTLGIKILNEGATRFDEPGLLISFEEFPRQLYAEALNWGIDLQALEDAGKLRVVWTPPERILESFRGKSDLIQKIVEEIGVQRIMIDSVTHFKRLATDEKELREILSTVLTNLKISGVNAIVIKELESQDEEMIAFEEYLVDASLRLHAKTSASHGNVMRSLEIRKTRGQGHVSGRHPFHLESEGLRIYPRLRVRDVRKIIPRRKQSSDGRLAFSVEGLDGMLGGGLLPGQPVVVSGYAGCGKSVLGYHFIDTGLKAGENAVLLTLKSDPESILAGARALGMDWQEACDADRLKILDFHPLDLCVEEVVIRLIYEARRSSPVRCVFDSINGFAQVAADSSQLREQLLIIAEIFRAAATTPLFLLDAEKMSGEPEEEHLWVSHMAACNIRFPMAETEGALRRFIAVAKHSGSDHAKELREIEIDDEGLHVHASATGLSGIMTGQAQRALRNLSDDLLGAMSDIDRLLQRASVGRNAAELVPEARTRLAGIDKKLREYFGGVDLTDRSEEDEGGSFGQASGVNVLIAEDNRVNQKVAVRMLEKLGFETSTVENGDEAVMSVKKGDCDLVLMDVQMPTMDGLEATRMIRAFEKENQRERTPIVAMTAQAMAGDRERCLEAGMDDYLTKPLDIADLRRVMRSMVPSK